MERCLMRKKIKEERQRKEGNRKGTGKLPAAQKQCKHHNFAVVEVGPCGHNVEADGIEEA
jgi:hypothetical protein